MQGFKGGDFLGGFPKKYYLALAWRKAVSRRYKSEYKLVVVISMDRAFFTSHGVITILVMV